MLSILPNTLSVVIEKPRPHQTNFLLITKPCKRILPPQKKPLTNGKNHLNFIFSHKFMLEYIYRRKVIPQQPIPQQQKHQENIHLKQRKHELPLCLDQYLTAELIAKGTKGKDNRKIVLDDDTKKTNKTRLTNIKSIYRTHFTN